LEDRPDLLLGRDAEVSILFCDLRRFSHITEKLGAAKTVELIADVMGVVTQCVLDQEGVVVDYAGDDVMAMWGAPEDQPDHAGRACRAALAMLATLPALNERWGTVLCEPLQLGIGINSGEARVGNVGTKIKLKYGALGNTVNIASRVQGATKHLGTPLLITEDTHRRLKGFFRTRQLCQVRAINITQPVMLFELAAVGRPRWFRLKESYETALTTFTGGAFQRTCDLLHDLIRREPDDGPSRFLLARASEFLNEHPVVFDPVVVLSGK
jgi:adenylate cyclase